MSCNIVYGCAQLDPKGVYVCFTVNVFVLLHNAVNKLELQRPYAVKM